MSKSINKIQSNVLLSKMQERPDIAKGFVKDNKERVALFWKQVTFELNSAGPPVKGESDWKKAWNDQKRYVRRKASENKKYERGTGGGPNRTQKLSPSEEVIFQLIGMKEAVEGVGTGQSFGLNQAGKRKRPNNENEEPTALVIDEISTCINEEHLCDIADAPVSSSASLWIDDEANLIQDVSECCNTSPSATICDTDAPTNKVHQPSKSKKTSVKMSLKEVALKELELQQEVCNKISEAVKINQNHYAEVERTYKKIHRSLDRIYDQQKLNLKEHQRHNTKMEKLRESEIKSKIEKNLKIIELEELKLEIMRSQK